MILEVGTSNVTVGGTVAGARNVISGNDGSGVTISGADLEVSVSPGPFSGGLLIVGGSELNQANTVEGNYIGVAAGGNSALPNSGDGIDVASTALNAVIGGTAAGAGNVVSGNSGSGVDIDASGLPSVTPLYLKADGNTNNSASVSTLPVGGATLFGGVTYGPGITGEAWQFNDTPGELVSVSDPANNLASTAVTLSAWINPLAQPAELDSLCQLVASLLEFGENYGLFVEAQAVSWSSSGILAAVSPRPLPADCGPGIAAGGVPAGCRGGQQPRAISLPRRTRSWQSSSSGICSRRLRCAKQRFRAISKSADSRRARTCSMA